MILKYFFLITSIRDDVSSKMAVAGLGFVIAFIVILTFTIFFMKRAIFQDTTSHINRLSKLDNMNREKEKLLAQKLTDSEAFLAKGKAELEAEEKRLKQEAQRAANQLYEDIVKKAKLEAEDIVKKAQGVRDKMRVEAMIEAESKVIELCQEIVAKLLSPIVQVQMNDQIIQEFLKELEQADLSKVGKDANLVEISSGRAINDETQKVIKSILENKLGHPVEVAVKEEHELLGGVVMKFGTMIIDGSLLERLKETSDKMKDELSWKHSA